MPDEYSNLPVKNWVEWSMTKKRRLPALAAPVSKKPKISQVSKDDDEDDEVKSDTYSDIEQKLIKEKQEMMAMSSSYYSEGGESEGEIKRKKTEVKRKKAVVKKKKYVITDTDEEEEGGDVNEW